MQRLLGIDEKDLINILKIWVGNNFHLEVGNPKMFSQKKIGPEHWL